MGSSPIARPNIMPTVYRWTSTDEGTPSDLNGPMRAVRFVVTSISTHAFGDGLAQTTTIVKSTTGVEIEIEGTPGAEALARLTQEHITNRSFDWETLMSRMAPVSSLQWHKADSWPLDVTRHNDMETRWYEPPAPKPRPVPYTAQHNNELDSMLGQVAARIDADTQAFADAIVVAGEVVKELASASEDVERKKPVRTMRWMDFEEDE